MKILVILALVYVCGCVSTLDPVVYPDIDSEWKAYGATLLDKKQKDVIAGKYIVEQGALQFGDTVAVRHEGERIAMYSTKNVVFVSGYFGFRDTTARLLASWRSVTGSQAGRLAMNAQNNDGLKDLKKGSGKGLDLTLIGTLEINGESIPIKLVKKASINTRLRGFQIIAHRGGGRNSERLGQSENSIEMMKFASWLGATGIEIDVHMTKDRIPIVFHDPTFSARTVQSPYVIGPLENYTLAQMRAATRLINGEQIPTLREALKTVIDSTNLMLIWLDVKKGEIVDSILAIQQEMLDYAKGKRTGVQILFGIPDDGILSAYKKSPRAGTTPVLCELDVTSTRSVNAVVWAPRFTAGIQADVVAQMQTEGRQVFVWTLDDADFIRKFLAADVFDGVLTNYPTLLAAIFYNQGAR